MIYIAVASNENYLPGAIATLASARLFTDKKHRIHVFFLHDGLSRGMQEYSARVLSNLQGDLAVEFLYVDPDNFSLCPSFWADGNSTLTYARLLLPSLLPREIEKIIYLDADLLVKNDLSCLFSVQMDEYEVAACVEKIAPRIEDDIPLDCIDMDIDFNAAYFNAGVMVLNLNLIRYNKSFEKALSMLISYPNESFCFHDQSALNYFYQGNFQHLDEKWNAQLHAKNHTNDELLILSSPSVACIYHFVAKGKPWSCFSHHPMFIQHRELLGSIAPGWENIISCTKEKKLSKLKKLLSAITVILESIRFLLFPGKASRYSTLLYWIHYHHQRSYFEGRVQKLTA